LRTILKGTNFGGHYLPHHEALVFPRGCPILDRLVVVIFSVIALVIIFSVVVPLDAVDHELLVLPYCPGSALDHDKVHVLVQDAATREVKLLRILINLELVLGLGQILDSEEKTRSFTGSKERKER